MKRFKDLLQLTVGSGGTIEGYIFLYGLVSLLKPSTIVEIGTNYGIGSIVMALALKENNLKGYIYTYDISKECLKMAYAQYIQMDVQNYINFNLGTSNKVRELKAHFDLAFVDGDHTYEGVKKDFENLKNISDYIVFHDTDICGGVKKFTDELEGEKVKITKRPVGTLFNGKKNSYFNGFVLWRKT